MQHNQREVNQELIAFVGEERVRRYAQTPQDPLYHAEGDVLIHLGMMLDVCEELCPKLGFSPEEARLIRRGIFVHDYAKPECTEEVDGRVQSPHHSTKGEKMVRTFLYLQKHDPQEREYLCALTRYHMHPTRLFSRKTEPEITLAQLAISLQMPCKYLYALAYCDHKGRICPDQEELLTSIELFAELAKEQNCYDQPFNLAQHFQNGELSQALSSELKHYFCNPLFEMNLGWKYRAPSSFPSFKGEFIMMCGFPGVGKTTYIQNELMEDGTKIISLDDLREEDQELSSKNRGGDIYNTAKEIFKDYLRQKTKRIILDATSLSRDIRSLWLKIAHDYGYRSQIVLLERPFETLLKQNKNRLRQVPERVIERMLHTFDFPNAKEAHQITWKILS